jgi:hypothetical protein
VLQPQLPSEFALFWAVPQPQLPNEFALFWAIDFLLESAPSLPPVALALQQQLPLLASELALPALPISLSPLPLLSSLQLQLLFLPQ